MRPWVSLVFGGCAGTPCTCLLTYGNDAMSAEEIALLRTGADACFGTDPAEIEANAACLPQVIGREASTSQDILASLYQGGVVFTYDAVGYEDCCRVGGVSQFDDAFEYVGCAPRPTVTATTCLTPP